MELKSDRQKNQREFIAKLNKEIEGLEIIEVDERLTTVSADRMLNESNKRCFGKGK